VLPAVAPGAVCAADVARPELAQDPERGSIGSRAVCPDRHEASALGLVRMLHRGLARTGAAHLAHRTDEGTEIRADPGGEKHCHRAVAAVDRESGERPQHGADERPDDRAEAREARPGARVRRVAAERRHSVLPRGCDVERIDLVARVDRGVEPSRDDPGHRRYRLMSARRTSTLGSRIKARYLVIVRRATRNPCWASSRASSASESGARGSSAAISSRMTALIVVIIGAPPLSVASRREKKCLNSNRPRGVAMY